MKISKLLFLVSVLFYTVSSYSQNTPSWLRYPAISPDGQTIAFGYKGDIYTVPVRGGIAMPLTIHEAQDMMPVWSHDGKSIAFASDRYGNFDVFVMPASGGAPLRLTYNSAADYPTDFSPDDQHMIFGSARNAPAESMRFSIRLFRNLYEVPVTGGGRMLISAAGMENAHYNSKGTQIRFPGYQRLRRRMAQTPYFVRYQRHLADGCSKSILITKSVILMGKTASRLFSHENNFVYYLSEKNGVTKHLQKGIAKQCCRPTAYTI